MTAARPCPAARPTGRLLYATEQAAARIASPGYPAWLRHIAPAGGCTRPIRLVGQSLTVEAGTGRVVSTVDTKDLPDGAILKACGNRRAAVCPPCSKRYQRDAFEVFRSGLVGPTAGHPAVFATFTAPSFGQVHTRVVRRHTCTTRRLCVCRPEPCHARRDPDTCPHGRLIACYARHRLGDTRLGTPICLDCYDHSHQVVWNYHAGLLWHRTTRAIQRHLRAHARRLGLPAGHLKLSYAKVGEVQRRAVLHFHVVIRLDGRNPTDPTAVLPPPTGLGLPDLIAAIEHAARTVTVTTDPHPTRPQGWAIGWGDEGKGRYVDTRAIPVTATGDLLDNRIPAYLAKYVTKSTEATGHLSARITADTIDLYADPDGTHPQRLIDACWTLG